MQALNELLLIEDDAVTREVLTLLLADDGWQVHSAEDGETALAFLRKAAALPSLVLCDRNLPGISGNLLANMVRQVYQSAHRRPPVLLAMTAARRADFDDYDEILIKPFTASQVREAFTRTSHNADENQPGSIFATDVDHHLSALPVIDESVFFNLRKSMGAARLQEFYAFVLTDAGERLKRMETGQSDLDLHKVTSEAHMLKGAAGMVGARRLALLAEEIESLCATGSADGELLSMKLVMIGAALADIPPMLETLFPVWP